MTDNLFIYDASQPRESWDGMSSLQAIAKNGTKSGQRIIQAITHSARELKTRRIPHRLQWVPGHCADPGNKAADKLAEEAVGLVWINLIPLCISSA